MIRKILCFFDIHKYNRRVVFRIPNEDGTIHNITQPYCIYCNNVPDWWYR